MHQEKVLLFYKLLPHFLRQKWHREEWRVRGLHRARPGCARAGKLIEASATIENIGHLGGKVWGSTNGFLSCLKKGQWKMNPGRATNDCTELVVPRQGVQELWLKLGDSPGKIIK